MNLTELTHNESFLSHPYPGLPGIVGLDSGAYHHRSQRYRALVDAQERQHGVNFTEDFAAPGQFRWELGARKIREIIWFNNRKVRF